MSKIEEMQAKLNALIQTAQNFLDADELDKAEEIKSQADKLADKIETQKKLDQLSSQLKKTDEDDTAILNINTGKSANFIRACLKKFGGKSLTQAEDALLMPSTSNPDGENGEAYILPQDISTKIETLKRQYRSMREVCGKRTTTAMSGSYPVENLDSVTGLIDFSDGTDAEESGDAKFSKVTFSLHEYGKLMRLSNTLIALSDNDLINYIVELYAKAACITENEKAIETITKNKTVKTLDDWISLNSSINTDLDPAALYGTVIVTNQDGFNYLDNVTDQNGKPLMQPDITQPARKLFKGYPVYVFGNRMLPSTKPTASKAGYAPIYYGDLDTGVKFVDLNLKSFATSKEAGFKQNTTYARLIEYFDVIQNDPSDECYCVGQLKVAEKTGA